MPYKYFGRVNQDFGRPLWEIIMNLKNFGKGRLVTRSAELRKCPHLPSFYKIVSVHPHLLEYPDDFRGNIFVEQVFQGRQRAHVIDIGTIADRADFQLVQKSQEADIFRKVKEFMDDPANHKPIIRPKTTPLPPVWKLFIARERNISPDEVPEMPIIYEDVTPELSQPTRIAEEGEQPQFRLFPKYVDIVHEEFYEHVIWNQQAAREKYCSGPPPEPIYQNLREDLLPLQLEKKAKSSSKTAVRQ